MYKCIRTHIVKRTIINIFGNEEREDINLNESDESQDIDGNELCELIL